jgi:hypothetical protein
MALNARPRRRGQPGEFTLKLVECSPVVADWLLPAALLFLGYLAQARLRRREALTESRRLSPHLLLTRMVKSGVALATRINFW